MRRLVLDDVADLEPQPLRVPNRTARDLDLAVVQVDPEDATGFGSLAQQTREEPVATPEVDDESLPRNEPLHEGQVGQKGASVHEQARTERRRAIAVDRSVERGARARAGHQGTRQRTASAPSAVLRSGSVRIARSVNRSSTRVSAARRRSST